jgi:Na+/citrate or Na+/malate symporter
MCSGNSLGSTTRSSFLWANATLLVGAGHLWLTQTENLHPHRKRPGIVVYALLISCLLCYSCINIYSKEFRTSFVSAPSVFSMWLTWSSLWSVSFQNQRANQISIIQLQRYYTLIIIVLTIILSLYALAEAALSREGCSFSLSDHLVVADQTDLEWMATTY